VGNGNGGSLETHPAASAAPLPRGDGEKGGAAREGMVQDTKKEARAATRASLYPTVIRR